MTPLVDEGQLGYKVERFHLVNLSSKPLILPPHATLSWQNSESPLLKSSLLWFCVFSSFHFASCLHLVTSCLFTIISCFLTIVSCLHTVTSYLHMSASCLQLFLSHVFALFNSCLHVISFLPSNYCFLLLAITSCFQLLKIVNFFLMKLNVKMK